MMTSNHSASMSNKRDVHASSGTTTAASAIDRHVGSQIAAARRSASLTRGALAERSRISESTLAEIEHGSARPAGTVLVAIAQALQVRISQLF